MNLRLHRLLILGVILLALCAPLELFAQECPYDEVEVFVDDREYDVMVGDQICYNLKVNHFDTIIAFNFNLNYDQSVLRFDDANTLISTLPGFNFDKDIHAKPGNIGFLWSSPNFSGFSIDDGEPLVEVCFTVIGDPGKTSIISVPLTNVTGVTPEFAYENKDEAPGCSIDFNADVTINSIPEPSTDPQAFVIGRCGSSNNGSEGIVEIRVFYGTPPYILSNVGGTVSQVADDVFRVSDLTNGNYTFTVTDANGRTSVVETVLDDSPAYSIEAITRLPTCYDRDNGSITLSVKGGRPFSDGSYFFNWHGYQQGRNEKIIRLSSNTYNVTVQDSLGCKEELSFDLITEPISVSRLETVDALCEGGSRRGRVTVQGQGGIVNDDGYPISIYRVNPDGSVSSSPEAETQTLQPFTTLLGPGQYQAVVGDANDDRSCLFDTMFTIGTQRELVASVINTIDADCPSGQSQFVIAVDRTGGSGDVPFNIQVVDLAGNEVYDEVSSAQEVTTSCLTPGEYIVRISEPQQGCESTDTLALYANTTDIERSVTESPACPGDLNGYIALDVSTSFPPLFYDWSNGQSGEGLDSIGGLAPGNYDVIITDSIGVETTASFTIADAPTVEIALEAELIACPGGLGLVRAVAIGESSDLEYTWSPDPTGQTGSVLPDVPAGMYVVTARNARGCVTTDSVMLTEPTAPIAQVSNIAESRCANLPEGRATVLIVPNDDYQEPFFFEASSGAAGTGNNFSVTDFQAGRQWVVFSDGTCVFDTVYIDIPSAAPFAIDTASLDFEPILCNGGTTTINLSEQNNEPVTYRWLDDNSSGNVRVGIGAGTYLVELSQGDCAIIDTVVVTEPTPVSVTIDSTLSMFAVCGGDNDTRLVAVAEGGTVSSDYRYSWSDGSSVLSVENAIANIGPGTYTVNVVDDNDCPASASTEVTEPSAVIASIDMIEQPLCTGDFGKITIASATGGTGAPYRYQVNTAPALALTDTAFVIPGDITVRVFDQDGCSWDTTVNIIQPPTLAISLGPDKTIELGESVNLSAAVTSDANVDMIVWTPDSLSCVDSECLRVNVSPIITTTYTATVITDNGCTVTDDITVNVQRSSNVYIPNAINPNSAFPANTIFKVYGGAGVQGINFIRIYDRWGELVHAENTPQGVNLSGVGTWQGLHQGTNDELDPGVYTYHVEVSFLDGGAPESRRGTVTLVR